MNKLCFLLFSTTVCRQRNLCRSSRTQPIDLEQLDSSNLIGGTSAYNLDEALDLDGVSMTLDINQIGSSSVFRSDGIDGDNFLWFSLMAIVMFGTC